MKKLLFVILTICLLLTATSSHAAELIDDKIILSELTEDECLAFIMAQGIEIPKELIHYENLGKFVKDIITVVENYPNFVFVYNYYVTLDFANTIQDVVNEYYGSSTARSLSTDSLMNFFNLEDSETVGAWGEEFRDFNCYAYALGYNNSPNGDSFFPHPGSFYNPEQFDSNGTIEQWAQLTKLDLDEEGYSCTIATTDYAEAMSFSNSHIIICLRKSDYPDFHYMRYDVNSWYHKPGESHILRFLYDRPDHKDWTNECSIDGVIWPGVVTYSGTIWYFAIDFNHNYCTQDYTGNHYHMGNKHYFEVRTECLDCGDIILSWEMLPCSGPPCSINGILSYSDHVLE